MRLRVIALVMVLSFIGILVFLKIRDRHHIGKLRQREYGYSTSRAYVIADYLEEKQIGKKALIITLSGYENDNKSKMLIDTLVRQLEPEIEVVTVPILLKDENRHHFDQMESSDFNKLINPRSDCDIIISTISLPGNFFAIKVLKQRADKIPFIIVFDGDLSGLRRSISAEKIKMVIVNRPDADISSKNIPDAPLEAFSERYLMITPDNLKEKENAYKKLFK